MNKQTIVRILGVASIFGLFGGVLAAFATGHANLMYSSLPPLNIPNSALIGSGVGAVLGVIVAVEANAVEHHD